MACKYQDILQDKRNTAEEQKSQDGVITAVESLSLNQREASSMTSSLKSNRSVNQDDETSVKLFSAVLDGAPALSQEPFSDSNSRVIHGEDSADEDISLNCRHLRYCVVRSSDSEMQTFRQRSCNLTTNIPCSSERTALAASLEMNIPPSVQEPRINNTEIPIALAEQQLSFRTVSTITSELPPINVGSQPQVISQAEFCSIPGSQVQKPPVDSVSVYISSEDNSNNIPMASSVGQTHLTTQPVFTCSQVSQNGSRNSRNLAPAALNGRQISYNSSHVSLKSAINYDCPVRKLPWKIINRVALTLQCPCSSATWKDLVEVYGWDYERTYLFENSPHQYGIFFSLLHEPEFQDYTLEQLRQDLLNLPRIDILSDLNRMVTEHNLHADSGAIYHNHL